VFEFEPTDTTNFRRTVLRDVLDFRLHTSWVRLALSEKGPNDFLQTPLTDLDRNRCLMVEAKLPRRIPKSLRYEFCAPWPLAEGDEDITLLHASETGVYNPLDLDRDIGKLEGGLTGVKTYQPGEVRGATGFQYYSGLQLNFFGFTAPERGDRISKAEGPEPQGWKRTYGMVLEWVRAHAWEFVNTVNNLLSDDAAGKPIKLRYNNEPITEDFLWRGLKVPEPEPYSGKPNPKASNVFTLESLAQTIAGVNYKDMESVHKKVLAWDFFVSGMIEDAIYKEKTVRERLRAFLRD